MTGRTDQRPRSLFILILLAAFAIAAVVRMGYWQVVRGAELQTQATDQVLHTADEPAVRGTIYDRNGVILATTAYREELGAYPSLIATAGMTPVEVTALADRIGAALHANAAGRRDLLAKLEQTDASGRPAGYVVLDRELSQAQSDAIRALDDDDNAKLALTPHPIRVYPLPGGAPSTTLASQLLGFVSSNGHGNYGIEQQYDATLAGTPTTMTVSRDPFGRPLQSSAQVIQQGVAGKDIRLTIDATLQLQLEKELYAAWVADKAKVVSGLVLDPHNGRVLAWASVPGYDANDYSTVASQQPLLLQVPHHQPGLRARLGDEDADRYGRAGEPHRDAGHAGRRHRFAAHRYPDRP